MLRFLSRTVVQLQGKGLRVWDLGFFGACDYGVGAWDAGFGTKCLQDSEFSNYGFGLHRSGRTLLEVELDGA